MLSDLIIFLSLSISFTIVFFMIPKIVKVARIKYLFDIPNLRSASKQVVPRLGGIAILFGFIISLFLSSEMARLDSLKYMMAGIFIMFLIGIKDDLIGLSAKKKLFFQFTVALLLVFPGNCRITDLHGIFGWGEINYIFGAILSIIIIVGLINAVNLTDGIDGLAGGISLLTSIVYGYLFFQSGEYVYALVCLSLTGSLIAFLIYNIFGKANKIFMGDSGSLVLGTILAILTIQFNESTLISNLYYSGAPAISLAIVIIPVTDTLRVFAIRLYQSKSPFSPDMNHIHHHLLRLTKNHLNTTLIILGVNGLIVLFAFSFIDLLGNAWLFFILLFLSFFLAWVPARLNRLKDEWTESDVESKSIFALFFFNKMRKDKEPV